MSCDPKEILAAASQGRVLALFTVADQHLWGQLREGDPSFVVHPEQRDHDVDLLDLAASTTFLTGGDVHIVTQGHMPQWSADKGSPIAAVYRW